MPEFTKQQIDQIHLWTMEGKRIMEILQLLPDGFTWHQVARLREKYGRRTAARAAPDYTYEPVMHISLRKCLDCGADKSYACPVPRCPRYDGGHESAERCGMVTELRCQQDRMKA